LNVMHAEYFAGIGKYDFAGVAFPSPNKKRTVAITGLRFAVDDIMNTLFLVEPDGSINYNNIQSFSSADYAFLISFAQQLSDQFGASGEFAMAYVVAHEVGHHVQDLLGVTQKMEQLRQQVSETEYNKYSVRLELQADFYAGVWAHYDQKMKNVINPEDIQQALTAANAIGDDRLQQEYQGTVTPDSFTHGTSAQRMYWFKKGYETGDLKQGNTFASSEE